VSRRCSRSQAPASAVPYGEVAVLVVICGSGQAAGSTRASSRPCLRGRPLVPGRRGGAGSHITRSERNRPSSSTGQQPGQPGHVVVGVEDDQDWQVALAPVPGGD